MIKIGIAGAPSSGKTTIAQLLKLELCKNYNNSTFHVTEAATDYIQRHGDICTMVDQLLIYSEQADRENSALKKSEIVISDCPTFLTYLYSGNFVKTRSDMVALAKLYYWTIGDLLTYDVIIFTQLQNFKPNGIRRNDPTEAEIMDKRILDFLNFHKQNFILVNKDIKIPYLIKSIEQKCGSLKK